MDYSKYYDLESYIFNEVKGNFHEKGFLNPSDFFCIIIWKANRAKSNIAKKFNMSFDSEIKRLTSLLYKAKSRQERMRILIEDYRFYLPMASAILSVLYSEQYSIYDFRVYEILDQESKDNYFSRIQNWKFDRLWAGYEVYLSKVLKKSNRMNYREADKFLWGLSFKKQLKRDIEKWETRNS